MTTTDTTIERTTTGWAALSPELTAELVQAMRTQKQELETWIAREGLDRSAIGAFDEGVGETFDGTLFGLNCLFFRMDKADRDAMYDRAVTLMRDMVGCACKRPYRETEHADDRRSLYEQLTDTASETAARYDELLARAPDCPPKDALNFALPDPSWIKAASIDELDQCIAKIEAQEAGQ